MTIKLVNRYGNALENLCKDLHRLEIVYSLPLT